MPIDMLGDLLKREQYRRLQAELAAGIPAAQAEAERAKAAYLGAQADYTAGPHSQYMTEEANKLAVGNEGLRRGMPSGAFRTTVDAVGPENAPNVFRATQPDLYEQMFGYPTYAHEDTAQYEGEEVPPSGSDRALLGAKDYFRKQVMHDLETGKQREDAATARALHQDETTIKAAEIGAASQRYGFDKATEGRAGIVGEKILDNARTASLPFTMDVSKAYALMNDPKGTPEEAYNIIVKLSNATKYLTDQMNASAGVAEAANLPASIAYDAYRGMIQQLNKAYNELSAWRMKQMQEFQRQQESSIWQRLMPKPGGGTGRGGYEAERQQKMEAFEQPPQPKAPERDLRGMRDYGPREDEDIFHRRNW